VDSKRRKLIHALHFNLEFQKNNFFNNKNINKAGRCGVPPLEGVAETDLSAGDRGRLSPQKL
jgi:hypothetical protein